MSSWDDFLSASSGTNSAFTSPTDSSAPGTLMDNWYKNQLPYMKDQLNSATGRANFAGNAMMDAGTGQMDDYNQTFRPTYGKLADYVNEMGSDTYRESQRNQAMEGVQNQFDTSDAALRRRMQGVGANSGAYMEALASQAAQRALAKVGAATASDNNLRAMYGNGLSGMANLGLSVNKAGTETMGNAVATFGKPLSWGQDIAKTGGALQTADTGQFGAETQRGLGLGRLSIDDYTARQNAGTNWYNADSSRIQANSGQLNAQSTASKVASDNDPWSTIGGAFAAGLGKTAVDYFTK